MTRCPRRCLHVHVGVSVLFISIPFYRSWPNVVWKGQESVTFSFGGIRATCERLLPIFFFSVFFLFSLFLPIFFFQPIPADSTNLSF